MARIPYDKLYKEHLDLYFKYLNLQQKHFDLQDQFRDLQKTHIDLLQNMLICKKQINEIITAVLSAKQTMIGDEKHQNLDEKHQNLLEWVTLAIEGKLDGTG